LQHDVAGARLQIAAEDLHERRLAAAVRADQAIAVAVGELDGDVLEQRLGAELNRNIRSSKHFRPIKGGSHAMEHWGVRWF
jgi:hypothetical protein